jgi:hypothetical protein
MGTQLQPSEAVTTVQDTVVTEVNTVAKGAMLRDHIMTGATKAWSVTSKAASIATGIFTGALKLRRVR